MTYAENGMPEKNPLSAQIDLSKFSQADFAPATEEEIIQSCEPTYIAGLTLLGGEPMEPENQEALLPFLRRFRQQCPGKSIWCYSGYTLEQLLGQVPARCRCKETDALLSLLDVLVDGKFVQGLHDITLRFRGSSNQRLIDLHTVQL